VNRRTAGGLAWAALGAGALMTVAALVMGVARGDSGQNLTILSDDIIWFLSLALFVPVGVLIARRHPRNPVGWILIAIGLSEIISKFAYEYAARALIVAPGSLPGGNAMAWLSSWFWVYELALFPFMILLFPTGQSLSRRWSWLGWISISCSVVFTLFMLILWPYRGARFLRNVESFGVERLRSIEEFVFALFPVVMICLALSLVSLIVRYLRSAGLERQQLKWIAFVAGIGAANIVVNDLVLSPLGIESDFIQLLSETIGGPGTFAIAAGIAMLRYRLYDIDRIINRTLVYAVLTAMIGGAYAVIALSGAALESRAELLDSDILVAGMTLAVAAAFRPLRRRTQSFVDRRFYRSRYNALQTIAAFNDRLRREVDLEVLTQDLLATVDRTLQPAHARLWIRH
jgi:hypothetical protein